MPYKISICHPNKEEIQEKIESVNSNDALDFFAGYPWLEQIELLNALPKDEVYYSPSVRFTNEKNKHSLELTADYLNDKLMFSLWYERPVLTKIFFGLFGEKEVMKVIDKWSFDKETSLKHLNTFVDEKYDELEKIMNS